VQGAPGFPGLAADGLAQQFENSPELAEERKAHEDALQMPGSVNTLIVTLGVWFGVITIAVLALLIVVWRKFEVRKEDTTDLITSMEADCGVNGTHSRILQMDLDFAASTKHYGNVATTKQQASIDQLETEGRSHDCNVALDQCPPEAVHTPVFIPPPPESDQHQSCDY